MRKFLMIALGATLGGALVYLFDPDRGRSRRARLTDQASARARDAAESVKGGVEYQKGVARGIIHDVTEPLRRETTYDDETLKQKVRSEALGYWPDPQSVEIDISDGTVRVSGSVQDEAGRTRLIELIRDVDGVGLIDNRLKVRT